MENQKVYIVEDDIVVLSGLEAKFGSLGVGVLTSEGDGGIGYIIRQLIVEKVDFIVLDLVLPKIDGLELLKKIKEEVPSVPVFVYSNFSENDMRERCSNLGADYYYIKQDFQAEEFVMKIDKIIKNRKKFIK